VPGERDANCVAAGYTLAAMPSPISRPRAVLLSAVATLAAFLLAGCASEVPVETSYPGRAEGRQPNPDPQGERASVFGPGGMDFLNVFRADRGGGGVGGGGIGVNSFLWRASLDTINFMPLSSADPFGGVIITDWYTPPET